MILKILEMYQLPESLSFVASFWVVELSAPFAASEIILEWHKIQFYD